MNHWDAELTDLVTHRGEALLSYACLLTGDRREAEDLVQDALVKVYARFRRPRPASTGQVDVTVSRDGSPLGSTEGYVRRTIMNVYVDGYRRKTRWSGLKHLLAGDPDTRAADHAAMARTDVRSALHQLAPRQRACVVLRYYEDLTVPQIADALGIAQGTVKRHLHEATPALRALLGTDETTSPMLSLERGDTR